MFLRSSNLPLVTLNATEARFYRIPREFNRVWQVALLCYWIWFKLRWSRESRLRPRRHSGSRAILTQPRVLSQRRCHASVTAGLHVHLRALTSKTPKRYTHLYAFHRRHRNQRIPPAMAASTAYSMIGAYCFTSGHWTPSAHPTPINPEFQRPLPRAV